VVGAIKAAPRLIPVIDLTTVTNAAFQTAFVSGPLAPPPTYFSIHYEPSLLAAIERSDSFVIPAPGIDNLALRFLVSHGVDPSKITVYLANFQDGTLRPGLKWLEDLAGLVTVEGHTTGERDAAMTRDSDHDVLRYMTLEEQRIEYGDNYYPRISNTQKNERRRMGLPLHTLRQLEAQQ
jgi:hypothetical protein